MDKDYVGKVYLDDTKKEDTQTDATKYVRHTELPEGTRVVPESNTVMTLDFRPDRLNLFLDDDNVIVKQTKG